MPTSELCRKHGLSPATFYKLKARYGGMDLSDGNRLKQREDENAKLKRLLADAMLDNVVLKDLPGKPGLLAIVRHWFEHNGEGCNGGTQCCGR